MVKSELQKHYSTSRSSEESISLTWDDINLTMREKDLKKSTAWKTVYREKGILKSISGYAVSGQLLAIMGPTGCGSK